LGGFSTASRMSLRQQRHTGVHIIINNHRGVRKQVKIGWAQHSIADELQGSRGTQVCTLL